MLEHVACIMDTLEGLGLSISMDKTIILLRLVGSEARSLLKRLLVGHHGSKWIAIQRETVFHGLVLSGHMFISVFLWGF